MHKQNISNPEYRTEFFYRAETLLVYLYMLFPLIDNLNFSVTFFSCLLCRHHYIVLIVISINGAACNALCKFSSCLNVYITETDSWLHRSKVHRVWYGKERSSTLFGFRIREPCSPSRSPLVPRMQSCLFLYRTLAAIRGQRRLQNHKD